MNFLPIVARELGLAAKRPATYRIRLWTAAVGGVLAVGMMVSSRATPTQIGQQVFGILSVLAFLYALLSGVWSTADSLSEERREGTLGLLFLTNLRAYDVVAGKLTANSLFAAYGLVSLLPLLGLPVLLGSISGSQFWRVSILLLNTLVFSLAGGLLVSAVSRHERESVLRTFFLMLFVTLALPAIWLGIGGAAHSRLWDYFLLFPSPAYAFRMATDSSLRVASHEYRLSMSVIAGLSIGALIIAGLIVPRTLQERVQDRSDGGRLGTLKRWRFRGARLGAVDPFYWLLSRDRLPAVWLGLLLAGTLVFVLWLPSAFNPQRSPATPIAVFGSFAIHILYKLMFACDAARRFSEDKRSGALELMLVTPLPVLSILRNQGQALTRRYALPFTLLLLLNIVFVMNLPNNETESSPVILGGAAIALFDAWALRWVGMLTALREPRYIRAVLRALGAVMVWPWAAMLLFMITNPSSKSTLFAFFFWWFTGAAVYDAMIARWARGELIAKFRRFAANDIRPPRLLSLGPIPNDSAVLVRVGSRRAAG